MTIRDYLGILRQRMLLAVIVVALTTSSAVVLTMRKPPEYTAQSRLQVEPVASGSGAAHVLNNEYRFQTGIQTEAELLKSELVAKRVIKRLNLKDRKASDLIKDIIVAQIPSSEVLLIEVKASDPKLATALANVFPEEYINLRREEAVTEATERTKELSARINKQMKRVVELEAALRKTDPSSSSYALILGEKERVLSQLGSLEANRQELIDSSALSQRGIGKIIGFAEVPETQSTSDPLRTGVLGFIIGLPLALGLALLLESMTDSIRSQEEAEKILGVETLGLIPLHPKKGTGYVASKEEPYSAVAEAFRTLRINLESVTDPNHRRILLTSPGTGEGKTTTAANLGVAFAEAGRSALLVSADLRRPRLHHSFGVDPAPGLSDILKGTSEPHDAVTEVSLNLFMLPSGNAEARPDQLLHSVDVGQTLDLLTVKRKGENRTRNSENGSSRPRGSVVSKVVGVQPQTMLIDAPPVLGAAEVSTLANAADGVVLIIQMGVTRRQAAVRAAEQIRRTGGKILGVVVVGARTEKDYSPYQPEVETKDGDSTWAKVVSSLQK